MPYSQLIEENPAWLERTFSEMRYSFTRGAGRADITCRFFVHRRQYFAAQRAFEHPAAVISRIFLLVEGTARVQVHGKRKVLVPGQFYLLPAGLPFNPCYGPCELITRELHIYDATGLPVFDPQFGITSLSDDTLQARTLTALQPETEFTGGVSALDLLAMETVLRFLEPRWENLMLKQKQSERFREVIDAIRQSPSASIRINDLAQIAAMSPGALSKSFGRALGLPLKDYIVQIVLNRAKELLVYTDLTSAQIAESLGYSDPAYFHRVFQRKVGLAPGAFRRRSRRGDG